MWAQVVHQWGQEVVYEQVPDPVPKPDEVLIRVEACGVGRTVLNYIGGQLGARPEQLPRIPGHEVVGVVVQAGDATRGIRAGDSVMAYFYLICGVCDFCRQSHEPLCRNFAGNVGVAAIDFTDADFADQVRRVAPRGATVAIDFVGQPDTLARALDVLDRRGRLV